MSDGVEGLFGEVQLDVVTDLDHLAGVVGIDASGVAMVDDEGESVGSEPDIAAGAALSGLVAGVGLPAVMSTAERAGVVVPGLRRMVRWSLGSIGAGWS